MCPVLMIAHAGLSFGEVLKCEEVYEEMYSYVNMRKDSYYKALHRGWCFKTVRDV